MFDIFFWLIFGALSGWTTVLVVEPAPSPRRAILSVLSGVVGAAIGGSLVRIGRGHPLLGGFDASSLVIAVLFAAGFACAFNFLVSKRRDSDV